MATVPAYSRPSDGTPPTPRSADRGSPCRLLPVVKDRLLLGVECVRSRFVSFTRRENFGEHFGDQHFCALRRRRHHHSATELLNVCRVDWFLEAITLKHEPDRRPI